MSGFSLGPRQFQFMAPRVAFSHGTTDASALYGWDVTESSAGTNNVGFYESLLDLRAFNQDPGTALAMVNVAVQESGPFVGSTTNTESPAYCTVVDLVSAVKIPVERIASIWLDNDAYEGGYPSFLVKGTPNTAWDAPENRQYNTSQIIYGKWRFFATDTSLTGGDNAKMMRLTQGGEFGSGEVITAPTAYYYRLVVLANARHSVKVPAANCAIHASVVDLPEFVELQQMARLSGR